MDKEEVSHERIIGGVMITNITDKKNLPQVVREI
jgi:hypothetical protein